MRDRDRIYGATFRDRLTGMGIEELLSAPRSPWQNPFVERLIGSVRRECLDHIVVLGARHLRRLLASYFDYDHRSRTLPQQGRARLPPSHVGRDRRSGFGLPEVVGLHHRYHRLAA